MSPANSTGRRLLNALARALLSVFVAWLASGQTGAAAPWRSAAKRHADSARRRTRNRASDISSAPRRAKGSRRSDASGGPILEGVAEEDPEGRASWFYFKRAYPSG